MIDLLERIGSAVCHRMAERSFIWNGWQMPLCARCTGIYTGAFLAFCFFFWKKRLHGDRPLTRGQLLLSVSSVVPLAVDGFCSYIGLWESDQLLRVLTGSLTGAALPALFLLAGNFNPAGENEVTIYKSSSELRLLLSVSAAWGLCLWMGLPLYGVGAVASILGEVCFWAGVVRLLLKTLLDGKRLPYWKISFAAAFGLLFVMGGLLS